MSNYRLRLSQKIRNNLALLIVDGHKGRENPLAIKLLKDNSINTFVLPLHTSHITQMFDMGNCLIHIKITQANYENSTIGQPSLHGIQKLTLKAVQKLQN